MMYMLNHGSQYVIYAPYIQRIINFTTEMEFGYDGKHAAYQPHIVRASAIPPPPIAAAMGPSAAAHGSPTTAHVSPSAPESSRAAARWDERGNIFIKGLKNLISMCQSNDVVVRESHR
jgi:hypothetical protein